VTGIEAAEDSSLRTPLKGTAVLEYGTGVAVRYAGALLASLGANVVRYGATSAGTDLRSRAENVYLDSDKTLMEEDAASAGFTAAFAAADIVLRGYDPTDGDVAQIRDEYERWRAGSDKLVFVAVSPFGVSGPGSAWHGGDLQAQTLSGWTSITGNPGEAPLSMNYGIGALQHGIHAAAAAVAGMFERGAGGGGDFVDVAESDVIAACMKMYSLTYRFLGIRMDRNGLRAPGSSGRYPHTALPCKDGYIITICRSVTEWERFLQMMGNPAWGDEARYRDFYAMGTKYADEVDALVIPWLMEHTKDQIAELATRYKVPIAPLRTIDEVMRDQQFAHRGFLRTREVDGQPVVVPGAIAHYRSLEGNRDT
jgi:crotonobetainyl-CoA:carnitine CoA-transferase CaiB-like acyl-CoA transferase